MASRPRLLALVTLVAPVALLVALGGCDTGDGRDLAKPAPGATAPAPPTSDAPATVSSLPPAQALSIPEVVAGGALPARHTCDGDDIAPAMAWSAVPDGTAEVAISVRDLDAGSFVHWVVAGIDPAVTALGEGGVPEGAVEATNGFGTAGWRGPCPPDGEVHNYLFELYALQAPSGIAPGAVGSDAAAALSAAAAPHASITVTYGRPA